MKITLSKSQWQAIGKKAGWMKKADFIDREQAKDKDGKPIFCKKCKKPVERGSGSSTLCWSCHEDSLGDAESFYHVQ